MLLTRLIKRSNRFIHFRWKQTSPENSVGQGEMYHRVSFGKFFGVFAMDNRFIFPDTLSVLPVHTD